MTTSDVSLRTGPRLAARSYAIDDRINHYLVRNLANEAWKMAPPGGQGRSISAIFAHMHNVRLMWLKAAGYQGNMPAKLEAALMVLWLLLAGMGMVKLAQAGHEGGHMVHDLHTHGGPGS